MAEHGVQCQPGLINWQLADDTIHIAIPSPALAGVATRAWRQQCTNLLSWHRPVTHYNVICAGEKFQTFWDDEQQQWRYRDAKRLDAEEASWCASSWFPSGLDLTNSLASAGARSPRLRNCIGQFAAVCQRIRQLSSSRRSTSIHCPRADHTIKC